MFDLYWRFSHASLLRKSVIHLHRQVTKVTSTSEFPLTMYSSQNSLPVWTFPITTFSLLCRQERLFGFFKGLNAYLLHVTPNICIVFLMYEHITNHFDSQRKDTDDEAPANMRLSVKRTVNIGEISVATVTPDLPVAHEQFEEDLDLKSGFQDEFNSWYFCAMGLRKRK